MHRYLVLKHYTLFLPLAVLRVGHGRQHVHVPHPVHVERGTVHFILAGIGRDLGEQRQPVRLVSSQRFTSGDCVRHFKVTTLDHVRVKLSP